MEQMTSLGDGAVALRPPSGSYNNHILFDYLKYITVTSTNGPEGHIERNINQLHARPLTRTSKSQPYTNKKKFSNFSKCHS